MRNKINLFIIIFGCILLTYQYGGYLFFKIFPSDNVDFVDLEESSIHSYNDIISLKKLNDKPTLIILNSRLNLYKPLKKNIDAFKELNSSNKINMIYCSFFDDYESDKKRDYYAMINDLKIYGLHVFLPYNFKNHEIFEKQITNKGWTSYDYPYYIIIDEKGEIIKLGSSERLINSTEVLDFIK
jgi:hypothetical protein